MRSFLFLFSGIIAGLYISWPGILISKNWRCFNEIISKSAEDKISMKTIFKNAYKKNEGKLMFFVYESKFYNQNEVEVCVMNNTLLVRS